MNIDEKIIRLIYEAIDEHNSVNTIDQQIIKDKSSKIIHQSSNIDSLGALTLLVNIEEKITNNIDKIKLVKEEYLISSEKYESIESLNQLIKELLKIN